MSSFLLPLDLCEKLASAIARFWWRSDPNRGGMHWTKWENLCLPKEKGGIGFRMIHKFNLALLGKQLWRLLQFPDSLLARVLRGRYYKYSTPLRTTNSDNASYGWSSIIASKPLIQLGIRQKIQSGLTTNAWSDPWIPTSPARPARARAPIVNPTTRVSDFISKETKAWDLTLLESYVHPDDIAPICSLTISRTFYPDTFCWNYTKSGFYSVKSGYWVARNLLSPGQDQGYVEPSIHALQAHAWKIKAPQKIRHLIWQIVSGHLAITRNLSRRGMRCDNHCPRCGAPDETVNHAFFECPPTVQTWAIASTATPSDIFPVSALYTNIDYLFWRKDEVACRIEEEESFPWTLWFIWKARNEKLFRGITRSPEDIVHHAKAECTTWFEANKSITSAPPIQSTIRAGTMRLSEICMVDGSWTSENILSGMGWAIVGSSGVTQLMGACSLPRRLSSLHTEMDALLWAMESIPLLLGTQNFGTDCKDILEMIQKPEEWPDGAQGIRET